MPGVAEAVPVRRIPATSDKRIERRERRHMEAFLTDVLDSGRLTGPNVLGQLWRRPDWVRPGCTPLIEHI
jgi:hypothetical protein